MPFPLLETLYLPEGQTLTSDIRAAGLGFGALTRQQSQDDHTLSGTLSGTSPPRMHFSSLSRAQFAGQLSMVISIRLRVEIRSESFVEALDSGSNSAKVPCTTRSSYSEMMIDAESRSACLGLHRRFVIPSTVWENVSIGST